MPFTIMRYMDSQAPRSHIQPRRHRRNGSFKRTDASGSGLTSMGCVCGMANGVPSMRGESTMAMRLTVSTIDDTVS